MFKLKTLIFILKNMKALNDFVLIKRDVVKPRSSEENGIIFRGTEYIQTTGEVISAGEACKLLKALDKVYIPYFAKDEIDYKGEKYLYLHEKDIPVKL